MFTFRQIHIPYKLTISHLYRFSRNTFHCWISYLFFFYQQVVTWINYSIPITLTIVQQTTVASRVLIRKYIPQKHMGCIFLIPALLARLSNLFIKINPWYDEPLGYWYLNTFHVILTTNLHMLSCLSCIFAPVSLCLLTQRTYYAIITSSLRQNDVATPFWRNDDVINALYVRWKVSLALFRSHGCLSTSWISPRNTVKLASQNSSKNVCIVYGCGACILHTLDISY